MNTQNSSALAKPQHTSQLAFWTTCFRPVLDNISRSFVPLEPVLVGPWPSSGYVRCCSIRLVFDLTTSTTCCRPVADADSMFYVPVLVWPCQLVVLDGAAAVDLIFDIV